MLTAVLLLVAGIVAVAWSESSRQAASSRRIAAESLIGIADARVAQIAQWMQERRGDAEVISSGARVQTLLSAPEDPAVRRRVEVFIGTLRQAYDYEFVTVYDARGGLLLTTPADQPGSYPCVPEHVGRALRETTPLYVDLHRGAPEGPIHAVLVCPIRRELASEGPADGVVVLGIDPRRFLFPLLKGWPGPSPTGESVLARREGDSVVVLSETRHRAGTALSLRLPMSQWELPMVKALNGERGVMEGVDYRGVPVLAVAREIPGTSWVLVAKFDRAEVDAIVHVDTLEIGLAAAMAVALVAFGLWRWQWVRALRRELDERRRAEREIQDSRNFLDSILEQSPISTWVSDERGTLVRLNQACCRIMRVKPEEVVGRYNVFQDNLLIELGLIPEVRAVFEEGRTARFEVHYDTARVAMLDLDETTAVCLSVTVFPIRDVAGRITHAVIQQLDITERQRSESALRRSRELLRLVLDTIPQAVFWKDRESVYLGCNRAFARSAGLADPADVVGKTDFDLPWEPHEAEAYRADDRQVIEAAQPKLHILETQLTADGSRIWIDTSKAPLLEEEGHPFGVLGVFEDVTERKRMEEDLRARNEEMVRFTYTVSHDLKSPLVTIQTFIGYLEKDLEKGDRARVEADFGYIRRAASKMLTLLEELLELSRIGRKMNPPEDVTLEEWVRGALDVVAGAIAERGVQVVVPQDRVVVRGDRVVVRGDRVVVRGDRVRLTEVFQNLIDNAVKLMGDQSDPRVEIGVEEMGKELVFLVRDNGMGIDPRHQGKLFGLFEKLHAGTPGSGMGLALVQRIVQVHGGRIWAESAGQGQGATFRFMIPGARRH